jgi:ABC-type uncharacterized transport system YnjBCD substrate-binding protein
MRTTRLLLNKWRLGLPSWKAGWPRAAHSASRYPKKGAVSVYGLGRFPVTLYFEQWSKLLAHADELRTFLEANKSKLKLKEQPPR